jgi:mannosyltransferase
MRVCLDSIVFGLQRLGGISTYWIELCRHLARNPEIELHLRMPRNNISVAAADMLALARRVSTDRLPTRIGRYLPSRVERGAVHHSSYYRRPWSPLEISVVTVYDFVYERFRTGLPRAVHSWQKGSAIRRADGVLCISENTRRDLLDLYPDVDPARVIVTPLGVAFDRFFPAPANEGNPALADVVVFVGQRGGYKRFDRAVEGVSRVPSLRLGIVGNDLTGEETAFLDRHLARRWLWLGRAPDDALRRIYGSCFAFIYPSSYEGFGLPVLEAMACGCPVVTNRLSSLPEVAGDAALYSGSQAADGYAEQLSRLADSSLRARLIDAGLSRSRQFHWSRTISGTVQFYRTLVASKKPN